VQYWYDDRALFGWNLITGDTRLTAIEPDMQNVQEAIRRLNRFADARGHIREAAGKLEVKLAIPDRPTLINFQTVNLERYASAHAGPGRLDLVAAHAVLDLLNIRTRSRRSSSGGGGMSAVFHAQF